MPPLSLSCCYSKLLDKGVFFYSDFPSPIHGIFNQCSLKKWYSRSISQKFFPKEMNLYRNHIFAMMQKISDIKF